jgi:hypothetical protein
LLLLLLLLPLGCNYQANCEALMLMAGADVGTPQEGMYIGIPVEEWPRVVLSPSFAPCLVAIKVNTQHSLRRLHPAQCANSLL